MESRAAIAGHPLHPIFVTIPIGLWSIVPVCDLIHWWLGGDVTWKMLALLSVAIGLVGAAAAILTGFIDYPLAQGRAAAVAKYHMIFNIAVSLLFALDLYLRWQELHSNGNSGDILPQFGALPVVISLVAVILLGISGWLGGELVSRFGISVHEDAAGVSPVNPARGTKAR
jgi:uncharacterized membrane protein